MTINDKLKDKIKFNKDNELTKCEAIVVIKNNMLRIENEDV